MKLNHRCIPLYRIFQFFVLSLVMMFGAPSLASAATQIVYNIEIPIVGRLRLDGQKVNEEVEFMAAVVTSGGVVLWSNDGSVNDTPVSGFLIDVDDGNFALSLGDESLMEPLPHILFLNDVELFLIMWVDGEQFDASILLPTVPRAASAYDSLNLGGFLASEYALIDDVSNLVSDISSNTFKFGDGSSGSKKIIANTNQSSDAFLQFSGGGWKLSENGVTILDIATVQGDLAAYVKLTDSPVSADISGSFSAGLTIGSDKVTESMLKAVDSPVDEECLTFESTTGDFEWQSCGVGGGANTALSNLSGVAVNESLISDSAGVDDLGTEALFWQKLFLEESISFEGSSDDANQTTLTVTNPTADRTITIPNITGTLVTTGDTGSITSTMILNGTILEADLKVVNGPTDEQCLTFESTGGDFEWQSCGVGGGSWSDLTAPTVAVSMVSNATAETVTFDFQSAFTSGSQFLIQQSTGNPSGGSVVGIEAADADVTPFLIDNDGTITIPDAMTVTTTGGGAVFTDAIDLSDAGITNAVNVGANIILGTTATINFTNFDVSSAGALDVGSTITVGSSNTVITTSTGTIDADAIGLISSDGTGSTSNGSGLETDSDLLGLLQGCSDNNILKWDEAGATWNCEADVSGGSGVPDMNAFVDTTADTGADNNTTDYWDPATNPNITPTATTSEVLVMVTVTWTASNTGDRQLVTRIERNIGSDPTCNSSTVIGDEMGALDSNDPGPMIMTAIYVDSPATTSNVSYTVCADSDSAGNMNDVSVNEIHFTLYEINDAADLAEIYATNDTTLKPGEIVSIDPSLEKGVKRSIYSFDKHALGIVSTKPAKVIGGTGGEGVTGVPIALTGRVPLQVSTFKGRKPIHVGDYLTTSDIPGVAMLADRPGNIIARAMTPLETGDGFVMAFVDNRYQGIETEYADTLYSIIGKTDRGTEVSTDALTIRDDSLAGSVYTGKNGTAEVTFKHHLGKAVPVIQLTVVGEQFTFVQVAKYIQDKQGYYTGFIIKTFTPLGQEASETVVNYLVIAKPNQDVVKQ